jgi:hypothetical protein
LSARRAGELLAEMKERGERRKHSQRSHDATSEKLPPKLSDIGVTKPNRPVAPRSAGDVHIICLFVNISRPQAKARRAISLFQKPIA